MGIFSCRQGMILSGWIILLTISFFFGSCGEFIGFADFPEADIGDIQKIELFLSDNAKQRLYESVAENDFAPCIYKEGGQKTEAFIKVRGFTSRVDPKKNFNVKIVTPGETIRYVLEASGKTYQTNPLAFFIHRRVGLPAPQTESVGLFLNGEYLGHYTRYKPYAEEELEGFYGGDGELFEAHFIDMGSDVPLHARSDKKFPDDDDFSSLDTLIFNAKHMNDQEWIEFVSVHVDWREIVKYMIVHDFSAVTDVTSFNFYIYNNDGKMMILPWDNELSLTLGDYEIGGDNLLTERVLQVPFVRTEYNSMMTAFFNPILPLNIVSEIVAEATKLYDEAETAVKNDTSVMVSLSDFLAERQRVMDFLAARPDQLTFPNPLP